MGISNIGGTSGEGADRSSSTKPYLVRAIYQWTIDNGFTPQILVSTVFQDVVVPLQYVKDQQIVLNIHPESVKHLELGNDYVMCSARFSGKAFEMTIPVMAIMAIYAKENGQGIVFQEEHDLPPSSPPDGDGESAPDREKVESQSNDKQSSSHLKLVR